MKDNVIQIRPRQTENEIAVMLNVKRQAINKEMRGIKTSERIRAAICKLTNTAPGKMFPEHKETVNA